MARVSVLFVVIFCLIAPCTFAATIQWTGNAGNSLWNFANNWLGNAVPTANDDVIINALGGASVSISQPAVANSVTIAGGQYAQTLVLLSQFTVGKGGIMVKAGGILQVQSNNDLPLASTGPVDVSAGASLVFQSGQITGVYNIFAGASLTFSQTALKSLSGATLTNNGTTTIQASTIQLASGSTFINNANTTAVGTVTILRNPSDTSNNLFQNNGNFDFQGQTDTTTLTLQAPATFTTPLTIDGGSVTINDVFKSSSSISIPSGSTLTIGSGTTVKQFNVLKGTGILIVQGIAIVSASVSLSVFEVSDSGSLTLQSASSFESALVGGTFISNAQTSLNNLTLAGGTLSGPGTTSVSTFLSIGVSDTSNTNNFISTTLILYGMGQSVTPVYLLLGQGGQFHIAQGATFNIVNSFNIGIQAGKPLIVIDGTLGVTLTASETFTSNVDFSGNGALKVNAGTLVFNGNTVTIGTLVLSVSSFAQFQTVALTVGSVTGTGGFNLTAAPSPVSSITTLAVSSVGVINGNVNVGSFAVNTFNLWSGTIAIAGSSTNSATNFNAYGGTLSGAAKISIAAFNLNLALPLNLNGVAIKATSLAIQATGTGNIQLSNGATIISSSTFGGIGRGNDRVSIN